MSDEHPILKVCGTTRVADMRGAEAAGADFCGFITEIERSPRSLSVEQATLLARGCRIRRVLVVEDMPPAEVADLAEAIDAHAVQLHGGDADYISEVGAAIGSDTFIWRPIGLPEKCQDREALVADTLIAIERAQGAGASAIVLDTRTAEGTGGSGRTCDWDAAAQIVERTEMPIVLAGGLSPENLGEALATTGAAGVDLSSGLEAAPGRKSPARLRDLAEAWSKIPR